MPVKQRGESWQVDFRHGAERLRRSFTTQLEAVKWETEAKARLAKGLPLDASVTPSATTFRSVTDAVISRYWKGSANERNAVRNADEAVAFFGDDIHPSEIKSAHIDEWIDALREEGNSPATVNRKLAALSKILNHAKTRGFLDSVPHMERLKESAGRIRWYTNEEEAKIRKFFQEVRRDPEMDLLVVFLADVGCRLSNALNCRWKDVEAKHVRIWKNKANKPYSVPLSSRLRELVAERREGPEDKLFPNLDVQSANYRWGLMRTATGIDDDDAVIHSLRHTCASRLLQGGAALTVVRDWLGHKTIKMTERYAHLAPATLDAAVSILDRVSKPSVTIPADKVRKESDRDGLVTVVTDVTEVAEAA